MPRRRPAEVRNRWAVPLRPGQHVPEVPRVSAAATRAIAELERSRWSPGAIADALAEWTRFVHGPARRLDNPSAGSVGCPCCENGGGAIPRETLHRALHELPTNAARELRALIRPLDELYLARSIPEPSTDFVRSLIDD